MHHRKGLGLKLLEAAEASALSQRAEFLSVETLSPSMADDNYLKTYSFYKKCEFQPLFDLKSTGHSHMMVYMAKALTND